MREEIRLGNAALAQNDMETATTALSTPAGPGRHASAGADCGEPLAGDSGQASGALRSATGETTHTSFHAWWHTTPQDKDVEPSPIPWHWWRVFPMGLHWGRRRTEGRRVPQHVSHVGGRVDLLYAPFLCDTTHCYINRFRRTSRVARPWHGGEKMTAVWASRHEDLVSDGGVSPHVCGYIVIPDRGVVLPRCNLPGSAVDAGRDAVARARGAARVADGGVVYVPQAFHVSPCVSPINAQRVARFDPYSTHNRLLPKELCRDIP